MKHLFSFLALSLFLVSVNSQTIVQTPKHGMSTAGGLRMDALALNDTATILSFHATAKPGVWISIPGKTYILPLGSTDTLYIKATENIPLGRKYYMTESGFIDFKAIFPALPKGTSYFDYGESNAGGSWFIYDIPTKNHPSKCPESFAGNWYNAQNGNWSLGLMQDVAVYKNMVWQYEEVSFKRQKGIIRLKRKDQDLELLLKKDKNENLLLTESNKETTLLVRSAKQIVSDKKSYTEPIFKMDTSIYSGYIEGYSSRAGFKTLSVSVNDILTGEQNSFVASIDEDGQFTFKLPFYYPHVVFVRSKIYNGSVFLEPGESLFQYLSTQTKGNNSLFMGSTAGINSDLLELRAISGPDYNEMSDTVMQINQQAFKSYLLEKLRTDLIQLEEINNKGTLGAKAYQVKKMDLTYRYFSLMFEYEWLYESAYRKKNNIPRTQRQLDITYDPIPDDFYDFITPALVNAPVSVISTDYGSFINRLKYAPILRPSSFSITTNDIMDELKKSNTTLTSEDELLSDYLDQAEEIKSKIQQSGFYKQYHEQEEQFSNKYKQQLTSIYSKAAKEGKDVDDLKQALLDEGIALSNEDIKVLDARREFQTTELAKELVEIQKKMSPLVSEFHRNQSELVNEYFAKARINSRNEKLKTVFGIENGLIIDIMNSQDVCGNVVAKYAPLDNKKLLLHQASFKTPFIGEYLAFCNEATMAKIEENKLKKDYTLNEVPKTDADKVFDKIMSKYKGKVVYVDFWATWCGPCRSGISKIKPLKEEISDWNVAFVYITNQTSPEGTFNNMITDIKGEHYRLSDDDWNYLKQKFNISGIPHYVLVGKDGQVIHPELGHKSNAELKSLFEKHLK